MITFNHVHRLRTGGDCESADLIKADPKRIKAASDSFRSMSSLGDKVPDQVQVAISPYFFVFMKSLPPEPLYN